MITPFCTQQFTATQLETCPQFCTNFMITLFCKWQFSDSTSQTCKHTQPSMAVDTSAQESASGTYPQQTESMLHHKMIASCLILFSNPNEISQVAPSFDASTFRMHFLSSSRNRCPTNPTLLDSNHPNHTW